MSLLWCMTCDADIEFCKCPDEDKKLRELAYDPKSNVAMKWCRLCDKHYARCKCEPPEFYVILAGKEWKMPDGGYKSMTGSKIPDLKSR